MQTANTNIILSIQNLSCGYGDIPIIKDFDLKIYNGEIVAITGPNGCGKSTLLKSIYQLCKINKGNIEYKGESLIGKNPEQVKNMGIAYFMQKNAIFPKLSVKENLDLSLNGMSNRDKKVKIEETTNLFPEINVWLNKTAGILSGGQRQQLALAMLITQDADLWLLDEPTAGLSADKVEFFLATLQDILKPNMYRQKTLIIVEHKDYIINKLTNRIINVISE
jgi:branched-chain amino acid transport system ATP-binding protein